MYYLLQQVSLEDLGQVLGRAQPVPIAIVVVCVLGSLLTRAARWQIYFLPQRRVPFSPLLGTLAISYMASTFLPLRAGELIRAVFLGQRQVIAVPRIVGTILLEKLFDFVTLEQNNISSRQEIHFPDECLPRGNTPSRNPLLPSSL